MTVSYAKKTVSDVPVDGRRVFVRVDFNVPLNDVGHITDDRRIREALPTIQYLIDHGARVVLASHLGRPGGKPNPKYTLRPVAERLESLLRRPVVFVPATVGPAAEPAVNAPQPCQVALPHDLPLYPRYHAHPPALAVHAALL